MNYIKINEQKTLAEFCQHLSTCNWMAIDTEFMRVDTYFPELCLIQVQSAEGLLALIDPLSFENPQKDLAPFWACLTQPSLIKVFHSARQDIEVLYQVSQQMPVSIFDTQIAGVFLGYGHLAGFAKMVEGELKTHLEKDQTRTNWKQRPLSDKQVDYALDDARFLAPLYEKVQSQLSGEQRQALEADFNALLNPGLYDINSAAAGSKLKTLKGLSGKQIAIAYALAAWRENFAVSFNKPKRWVMSDEVIICIAKRPPQTKEALYKVPSIKSSSVNGYGEEWIEIIDEVFAHPENWPSKPIKPDAPTSNELKLMDISQALVTQISQDQQCSASHLINKQDLLCILRQEESVLFGWRKLLLEMPLRALLNGEKSLCIKHGQLLLVSHKI